MGPVPVFISKAVLHQLYSCGRNGLLTLMLFTMLIIMSFKTASKVKNHILALIMNDIVKKTGQNYIIDDIVNDKQLCS